MFKSFVLAFCLVAAMASPAFAESPSGARTVALPEPTTRLLRLDWWNLRAVMPDTYSGHRTLHALQLKPLLSARLLGNVVIVSGTTVLFVDEETPNAARWGVGCNMSGCTASARGSF